MSNVSRTYAVIVVVMGMAACHTSPVQNSDVLRLMEKNGAGDLTNYSAVGFQQWFAVRPELAMQVAKMCEPLAKNSPANWAPSAEGTACSAAQRTVAFMPLKTAADKTAW